MTPLRHAVRVTERLVDLYDAVVLDLDGVLYIGSDVVPHARESVHDIANAGCEVWFATNNASRSAREVSALLTSLGFDAPTERILVAGEITAACARTQFPQARVVRIVGTEALAEYMRQAGFEVLRDNDVASLSAPSDADAARAASVGEQLRVDLVVQGHDPVTGWSRLTQALRDIDAGAKWIATNDDATIPLPEGIGLGNGSMVAALRNASGHAPDLVVGKPHPWMFRELRRRTHARRPLIVGDRLDTDIAWAHTVGVDSLLVRTGIDASADRSAPADFWPTWVADDLRGLLNAPQPW